MGNPKGLTKSGSGELGIIVCGVFLGCTSTGRVGLCFLWFFVQELLEAQPAVVLVLKRLRRRGKWLEVTGRTRNSIFVTLPTPRVDMDFDFQCTF